MASPLSFGNFGGASQFADPIELPISVATNTVNQRPGRADLQPWRNALPVAFTPVTGRQTIYRMGAEERADDHYWLSWSTIVNAIRGFEPDDTTERTYYTGDGPPKWTSNTIGLAGGVYPSAFRLLGMPAPISAPLAALLADGTGSATAEDRVYITTFVNDIGWESAPSPPSNVVSIKAGGSVQVSGLESVPTGSYNITKRRLYRLVTTTSGASSYFFQSEVAINVTTIVDNGSYGADILETLGWLPPPANSKCITRLWNGIVGVISGKSVRLSLPYLPYAYKLTGEMDFADTPVNMLTVSQTLYVMTSNDLYACVGSDPETIQPQGLQVYQPLTSQRGCVGFEDGIAWTSPNGLCWYGGSGFEMLTASIFTREQWQTFNPTSMILSRYLGMIFIFYQQAGLWKGMVYNPGDPHGVYYLDQGYLAVFRDPISDSLFVLDPRGDATSIAKFDAGAVLMTVTWVSKTVRQPRIIGFASYQVVARNYPVQVSVTVDGVLVENMSVPDDRPQRFPGVVGRDYQFTFSQNVGSMQLVRFAVAAMDLREA